MKLYILQLYYKEIKQKHIRKNRKPKSTTQRKSAIHFNFKMTTYVGVQETPIKVSTLSPNSPARPLVKYVSLSSTISDAISPIHTCIKDTSILPQDNTAIILACRSQIKSNKSSFSELTIKVPQICGIPSADIFAW